MENDQRGTEAADLRVIINDIDGALCQYCNEASDPYTPVSDWDDSCRAAFDDLCRAYNAWHVNHKAVGEISMAFWTQIEAELYETKNKLRAAEREIERLKAAL